MRLSPTQAVEVALEYAKSINSVVDLMVNVDHDSTATLRWANNTLTTNGSQWGVDITIVAFVSVKGGIATATISGNSSEFDKRFVRQLVDNAVSAAHLAEPEHHRLTLPGEVAYGDWETLPVDVDLSVISQITPDLGEVLKRGISNNRNHSGFAQHQIYASWTASLSGLRLRDNGMDGRVEMTSRSSDGIRSAWEGRNSRTFSELNLLRMDQNLEKQLTWQDKRVALPAGAYNTILPSGAVADLMATFDANLSAREALEGSGPFAEKNGKTMIGRTISNRNCNLYSDPQRREVSEMPYIVNAYDSATTSVFDTGIKMKRTNWVENGVLKSLCSNRAVSQDLKIEFNPNGSNLILEVEGGKGDLDSLIARTENALLVNCLWYIRDLDESKMLVTGTTRDGVYQVRDGVVVGAVNNFRFNESPLSILGRIADASSAELSQPRENAEEISNYMMPALVVENFNMSSVSEAS